MKYMKHRLLLSMLAFPLVTMAQNPIVRNLFAADPTARVFNNKVYVYPSHDIHAPAGQRQDWFCMADYHVFSSDNLTDWTDHGMILSQENVPWGKPDGYSMWAPDYVYKNGKYYFYFPNAPKSGRGFAIGVATADSPEGPFTCEPTPIPGVSGIDPCVLIDDNGQAYIYWSGMGIRGAALATVLCQIAALGYTLYFLADKRRFLHFSKPVFRLDGPVARQSLAIGVGPFLMNVAASLVALFVNQQLRKYGGDLAIGAYGIVNRFTMLFIMICMGFNQGLQPIAGYNYGALQYHRVREVFVLTAKWEVLVTSLCFLVSMLIPDVAVRMFTNDPELVALSSRGLRIMNSGFALVGFGMVSSNLFQCLGMVRKSIFLSLSRQLLFLLPLIYTLPLWMQEKGVWISFPISDTLNIIVSAVMIVSLFRKFNRLQDGDDSSELGGAV